MALTPIKEIMKCPTPEIREWLLMMRRKIADQYWWKCLELSHWERDDAMKLYNAWLAQEEAEYYSRKVVLDSQARRYKAWKKSRRRKPYCRA